MGRGGTPCGTSSKFTKVNIIIMIRMNNNRMNRSAMNKKKIKVGFIGQGYIGKNYADDFERRGYKVTRYGLEPEYIRNKNELKGCGVIFVAVPTPTTPEGFNGDIVEESVKLAGPGSVVVIKSTVLPGMTERINKKMKHIFVLHSPEFLSSATAKKDAANPTKNIIGIPIRSAKYQEKARLVLSMLPRAKYSSVVSSRESEFIKYATNTFYYSKIVYMNILYELSTRLGLDWHSVKRALAAEPWIGQMHIEVEHKNGRGAGGHCFIKDFAAFSAFLRKHFRKGNNIGVIDAIERKNIELLLESGKDLDQLYSVYGKNKK
ncbi:MAG: hypothetical protein A3G52_03375 [Candidatus Taylorbacteria bacterium RIFCSPLOWO2_12_FULL_43_20]|uniref:UDP-glucose/GDP-mannose dehydrogenase dimerisation domain-containing protein n=1 Tax=Candidatus Taylorbacteria bacterium RIFCSPLOWO2_12_FULL_43_20 TaxID=1802332 RepID=A0A1G2P2A2_9BACT|nr:MAG: hypothetical protein A2825_02320 [Candidatus Taylorbacteria bacterium RIFCSPHIGHO2_01_FULL_43_120]OHA22388.1 MAG: hypothetical protein A3B98_02220 [Candidatus Taylorbacteria bacterium RIFCSPHIGHO2_02_FULL_43_55]OHA30601.1 MAG: hypothetical protein A3B09_00270 [Candidatus Taylorbacteria bacterium RIFCSPLOWO2_01_FULL_43_83]OHA38498.1 MAG: hypothetical protein A3H58_02915 [Candidatus Taylorbacteria bacterium RIFCSPLOWO2_02_FULL_43_22b]OHA41849.1 MAG: hypothetical protein A3G52_03375 [Candi